VLTILAQWQNYEELYFKKMQQQIIIALPISAWLDNRFPGRWTERRGTTA
jgi:hypothetical protein